MWHDRGNALDCTGCRNTQVLSYLTEILWDNNILSDVTGCQKTQV
jgi:pyruvate/2-oxoacid:ferredoxin oxidoreductase beta subunit